MLRTSLIVLSLATLTACGRSPTGTFKTHFGKNVPPSVSDISVTGVTALAGSDVVLTFKISEEDLEPLLKSRGFRDVIHNQDRFDGSQISESEWNRSIKNASQAGIEGKKFYELTKMDGLIYYILIFDPKSGRAFYRYIKV